MSVLRRERRQWAPEPVVPPFPGANLFGSQPPTSDQALQASAVWACVQLLASTVSMMPLHAYSFGTSGLRVPAPDPPLLVNPSADATMPEWLSMLMVSALLRGNTFGRIAARDSLGFPTQIELQNPDRVLVSVDRVTGAKSFKINNVEVNPADMFHFRGLRFPGSPLGLSPVRYAALTINRELAIQLFTYGYFNDAPHPQAVLMSDQPIDQDGADMLKARLLARVQGREPLVLGAGVKYEPLSVSPEESQFLATQKLGVAEIARIYQVPPEKIGGESGNSMTYANIESAGVDFLTGSIQRWLTWIEASISALFPNTYHVRFDPAALLRTDTKTRYQANAIAIASKQLTPDEARETGDRPPLTSAQMKQLGMTDLEVGPSGSFA